MKKMYKFICILGLLTLMGCSANGVIPEARNIEIVSEEPDRSHCRYMGEVVGSQGNWITGDFTSNKALIVDARNELKNQAYELGGNIIYIQLLKNTNAYKSLGTTNTTAIGKVFKCQYI